MNKSIRIPINEEAKESLSKVDSFILFLKQAVNLIKLPL